jgi:hypothetical protein
MEREREDRKEDLVCHAPLLKLFVCEFQHKKETTIEYSCCFYLSCYGATQHMVQLSLYKYNSILLLLNTTKF